MSASEVRAICVEAWAMLGFGETAESPKACVQGRHPVQMTDVKML